MIRPAAALAVFVKTPGLTPIKTRLAVRLGRRSAEEFYRLSVAAVETTVAAVAQSHQICPYWAIAERDGITDLRWQRFERIFQRTGNLGERLGHVFADLQRRHSIVVAIGADSPQITPELIRKAIDCLREENNHPAHVLGRCFDGGFYLVGTNHLLPRSVWRNVPYSTSTTADCLGKRLASQGIVYELSKLSDVDRAEDVAIVREELNALRDLSVEQVAVLQWTADRLNLLPVTRPIPTRMH